MPGGPLVWCLAAGFGADRVGRVAVAVHLAVGADAGCLGLPGPAAGLVSGYRAEGVDRPGRASPGGVLAQALGAAVHHGGDSGQVGLACGIGQPGDAAGPGALRLGQQRFDARADPGVQDGGDVPGSGQVTGGDGGADDLGGVQAGQFGAPQGAEQPPGLPGQVLPAAGRECGQHQVAVAAVAGGGGLGGPDRVQDAQVVGVGQVALPGLRRGQLGAVAAQHVSEHGDRLTQAQGARDGGAGQAGQVSGVLAAEAVVAAEFGGGPGARLRVSCPDRGGEHERHVHVSAAGHRRVQPLPVLGPRSPARSRYARWRPARSAR